MRCAAVDVVDINSKWKIYSKHSYIPWNTYTQILNLNAFTCTNMNMCIQRSCNCEWNHSTGFACFLSLNHFCCWIFAFSPFLYPTNSFIQSSFFLLNLTTWRKFILWRAYFTLLNETLFGLRQSKVYVIYISIARSNLHYIKHYSVIHFSVEQVIFYRIRCKLTFQKFNIENVLIFRNQRRILNYSSQIVSIWDIEFSAWATNSEKSQVLKQINIQYRTNFDRN